MRLLLPEQPLLRPLHQLNIQKDLDNIFTLAFLDLGGGKFFVTLKLARIQRLRAACMFQKLRQLLALEDSLDFGRKPWEFRSKVGVGIGSFKEAPKLADEKFKTPVFAFHASSFFAPLNPGFVPLSHWLLQTLFKVVEDDIAPGETATARVKPTSESSLDVEFTDADGQRRRLNAGGYFESGYRGTIRVEIKDGQIDKVEEDINLY